MEIIKAKNKFDTRDQLRSLCYFNDYLIKKNSKMNVKTAMNIRKFAIKAVRVISRAGREIVESLRTRTEEATVPFLKFSLLFQKAKCFT